MVIVSCWALVRGPRRRRERTASLGVKEKAMICFEFKIMID
jgi:hypothetical protein